MVIAAQNILAICLGKKRYEFIPHHGPEKRNMGLRRVKMRQALNTLLKAQGRYASKRNARHLSEETTSAAQAGLKKQAPDFKPIEKVESFLTIEIADLNKEIKALERIIGLKKSLDRIKGIVESQPFETAKNHLKNALRQDEGILKQFQKAKRIALRRKAKRA